MQFTISSTIIFVIQPVKRMIQNRIITCKNIFVVQRNSSIIYGFVIVAVLASTQCIAKFDPDEDAGVVLYAVEEIRIGQMEGEDEYVFGGVNHVTIGKNGEMFVADRQVPVIRMYDSDGNFLRNVGREGRGPGEYLNLGGMRTFPDGRLAIWDQGNTQLTVYGPEGNYLENHMVNAGLHASDIFEVDHNGYFYVRRGLQFFRERNKMKYGWLKVSPQGEVVDTIRVPFDDEDRPLTFVLFTSSGDAHAFFEWPLFSMSPMGYLITGHNAEYAFELNLPDSIPKRIERDFTPVPVNAEEKKQWEGWVNSYRDVSHPIPDIKPAYKKILTDSQGRIWIWRYVEAEYTEENVGPHFGPESHWWEPPTFDVFMPDGSFYATVVLPFEASFRDARDEYVWAIAKGEFDEQYVVRYRLEEVVDVKQ